MTGEQQAHPILDRHSVETPLLLPPAPLLQWGAAKDGASASASMSMCTPVPDRSTRSNRPLAFTAASRSYPCAAARGNKGSQGGIPPAPLVVAFLHSDDFAPDARHWTGPF